MRTIMTIALAAVLSQNTGDRPDAHVARARIAAGDSYQNLFNFLCTVPTPRGGGSASAKATADRPTWYAEPVKVFDNLYFVGQSEYSAWAVTTSEGIILIDITSGHTPGTLSVLIPVRESGTPHLVALWGRTGLDADRYSLEAYIRSAKRFDDVVRQAGADIILSNHTDWDGSKVNLPRLATRAPGSPNPYVVGNAAARRYLKVAEECATARLLRLN